MLYVVVLFHTFCIQANQLFYRVYLSSISLLCEVNLCYSELPKMMLSWRWVCNDTLLLRTAYLSAPTLNPARD
jgi:hypothetical protein